MLQWAWSLKVWTEIFSKPHYWTVLWHTLWMSALCVALCILIALPVAYALATRLQALSGHVKVLITFAFLTDVDAEDLRLGAVPRPEGRGQLPAGEDRVPAGDDRVPLHRLGDAARHGL